MMLFEMAAAITAADGAMVLEGVDAGTRARVTERLRRALALVGTSENVGAALLNGTSEREALAMLERTR